MPFDSEAKLRDVGKKNLLPDTHTKKKFWKAVCYISIYIHTHISYIYVYVHTYHIDIDIYIYCTWIEKGNPSSALFQTVGITAQSDVSCLKESTDQVCISVQLCCKPNCMNQSIYCWSCRTEWSLTGLKIKSLALSFCAASIMADRTPLRWNPRCRCFGVISNSI